jgi:hypothetical protein
MIPARTGIIAEIAGELVAVEAFDDEGRALVLDRQKGRLVPAEALPGFSGLRDTDLVAIIPGGGWRAHKPGDVDIMGHGTIVTPVVAWGLKVDGSVEAYVWQDADGIVEAGQVGLVLEHPDEGRPSATRFSRR